MRISSYIIICVITAICGFFLSMLVYTWEAMVTLTLVAVGGCIIRTINENFKQLSKELKEHSEKLDNPKSK